MGKKAKKPVSGAAGVSEADAATISSLKEEGTKLFGRKEYSKALESYDKALKLVPEGNNDRALLHSNKAACHMMLKKYKDSVNDCSAALEAQPNFYKALCRRAKAYEQLGLYKQALSDVQKANRLEESTPESQEAEKRLRDIVSGKRPASGAVANGVGKKAAKGRMPPVLFVQAKCSLDNETRLVHMTSNVTYAELLDGVHKKFPGCGPVALKYLDKEGDLITITDKTDIQKAMAELVEQSGQHGPKLPTSAMLPPMRIQVTRVKEDEVPKPPAEEERLFQQFQATQQMLQKQQQQRQQQQQAKEEGEVYELDEWLVEFAQLFRECLGVDPDRHIELHNLGYEKCTQALESAVASDKALPLFDKAADRFQEVTANGLLNWGNVYMCVARKYIDEAATNGQPASSVVDKVETELKKAEQRYNESLQYKPDYYDSYVALGQLYSERAKLLAGFIFAPPKPAEQQQAGGAVDEAAVKAAEAKALEEQLSATNAALTKLNAKDVKKADPWFDKAVAMFAKALESLPEDEKKKEEEAAAAKDGAPQAPQQQGEEVSLKAHTQVLWGNLLYEISQVRGAVKGKWKPLLDEAVAKFRDAGCSESDIRGALLNHSKKDEIDIPPEPEPKEEDKAAAKEAEEKVEAAEKPKEEKKGGLGALPKQKRKT